MITIRHSKNRGRTHIDWLDSLHTFSFAEYYDEQWMSFGALRVINEDVIQPTCGFDMHSHHDMEILTYVVSGELKHQDNMGNGSVIKPSEIQRMSAGNGVRHSEFNHSNHEALHLLQIWILPEIKGNKPSYEQKQISRQTDKFILIGSQNGAEQGVTIHQNINLYVGYFNHGLNLSHELHERKGFVQLIKGHIQCNGYSIYAGDGVAIENEKQLMIECIEDAELLFFEML